MNENLQYFVLENQPKFEFAVIHKWILPLVIGTVSYRHEFNLQRIASNKITRQTYIPCIGAATIGFLYSKYVLNWAEKYYYQYQKDKEIAARKKKREEEEFVDLN
jgi:hypothetical protein